ncbi:hypothetical protein ABW19_dt0208952 [Dactylella cylindrospora]|nr:hypothetical protein ABW19_dt0208952 [Dactylella cylindrospora]
MNSSQSMQSENESEKDDCRSDLQLHIHELILPNQAAFIAGNSDKIENIKLASPQKTQEQFSIKVRCIWCSRSKEYARWGKVSLRFSRRVGDTTSIYLFTLSSVSNILYYYEEGSRFAIITTYLPPTVARCNVESQVYEEYIEVDPNKALENMGTVPQDAHMFIIVFKTALEPARLFTRLREIGAHASNISNQSKDSVRFLSALSYKCLGVPLNEIFSTLPDTHVETSNCERIGMERYDGLEYTRDWLYDNHGDSPLPSTEWVELELERYYHLVRVLRGLSEASSEDSTPPCSNCSKSSHSNETEDDIALMTPPNYGGQE